MKTPDNHFKVKEHKSVKRENALYDKHLWQFALKNSNIGVWDWNSDSNSVFYSKESKNILGFKDHEIGSTDEEWNKRVHIDDKPKYFQDFKDHVNGLNDNYSNEHRVLCKDGRYKWILDRGKVIEHYSSGKPKRIIGTHTDITKQKNNEIALKSSIKIIKKQNDKLNNFAHIVTHNLKEHAGNFESLLSFYDEADTDKEKEELVAHIKKVSVTLTNTINNLREIVVINSTKNKDLEVLNLKEYVKKTILALKPNIVGNKIKITNNISKDINVRFNKAYLESIFLNLLSNAIKYRHNDRKTIICLKAKTNKKATIVKIKDNGIGIDLNKYRDDVFGLYRTFHNNKNSEGVGLYITKNQIESFGGSISIKSKIDKGTTFTLKFPKELIAKVVTNQTKLF